MLLATTMTGLAKYGAHWYNSGTNIMGGNQSCFWIYNSLHKMNSCLVELNDPKSFVWQDNMRELNSIIKRRRHRNKLPPLFLPLHLQMRAYFNPNQRSISVTDDNDSQKWPMNRT